MNWKKIRNWSIGLIILLVLGISLKISWNFDNPKFPIKIITYVFGGVFLLSLIVWFVFKVFLNGAESVERFNSPKEIVGSEALKEAVIEELIIRTKIPYYVKELNDRDLIKPINEFAIRILDCKPATNKTTPNQYYGMVIEILEGNMVGIHTIYVPKDIGIKGVRENCMMYVERNATFNISIAKPSEFDNPLTHNQIIDIAKIEAEQDGADEDDVRSIEGLKIKEIPREVIVERRSRSNSYKEKKNSGDSFEQPVDNFLTMDEYENKKNNVEVLDDE